MDAPEITNIVIIVGRAALTAASGFYAARLAASHLIVAVDAMTAQRQLWVGYGSSTIDRAAMAAAFLELPHAAMMRHSGSRPISRSIDRFTW